MKKISKEEQYGRLSSAIRTLFDVFVYYFVVFVVGLVGFQFDDSISYATAGDIFFVGVPIFIGTSMVLIFTFIFLSLIKKKYKSEERSHINLLFAYALGLIVYSFVSVHPESSAAVPYGEYFVLLVLPSIILVVGTWATLRSAVVDRLAVLMFSVLLLVAPSLIGALL